jgi:hypothetical protein
VCASGETMLQQVLHIRRSDADDLAREIVHRAVRAGLVLLGIAIVIAGIAIAPLPGPGGLPVIVIGLMIILRNSFGARRVFVRVQRRYPKTMSPIRRLLRREPEIMPVAWQQTLRVERLILPPRFRFLRRARRRRIRRR